MAATHLVLSGRQRSSSSSPSSAPLMAANLAGGTHHAFAAHGEGFSVLNALAVAAAVALRDYG